MTRYIRDKYADVVPGIGSWDIDETPCRECKGRGYTGHDPDDPCVRCWGECIEPRL